MRLATTVGATFATTALASAVVLGGTGIANAQESLGSLTGSLGSDPIELTFEYAVATVGVPASFSGTATNNADSTAHCFVDGWSAEDLEEVEADVDGGTPYEQIIGSADGPSPIDSVEISIDPYSSQHWGFNAVVAEWHTAAAAMSCEIAGEEIVVYAYGPTGPFGSLDMGSLGS